MLFGTKNRLIDVPSPAINIDRGTGRWEASGTYLNGGAYQLNSKYHHRRYGVSWNLMDADSVSRITDYYSGVFGDDPIYMLDPFIEKRNTLPLNWSVPVMGRYDAPTLVLDNKPSAVQAKSLIARNLFLNPSFDRISNNVDIYRNLVPNPSAETVGGTQEIRRNRYIRPNMDNLTGLGPVNGAVLSLDAGKVRVAAPVGGVADSGVGLNSNCPPVVPGDVLTYSFEVTGIVEDEWRVSVQGSVLSANYNGPSVRVAAGETKRITGTVAFTGTGVPSVYILRKSLSVASTAYISRGMVERGSLQSVAPTPWFSGDTSPDPDLTPSWTGAVNASESVLTGTRVTGWGGTSYSSSSWATRPGGKSCHLTGKDNSNDTYVSIEGDTGGMRLGMVAGATYTAIGTIRMTAPMTGIINGRARTITLHTRSAAGGGYTPTSSTPSPNAAGEYQVRFTFTVPADAGEAFLRLYLGTFAGEGECWWDDFALVQGNYQGPYFDGSTRPYLRSNIATNPSFDTNLAGWAGSGTAVTPVVSTEWSRSGGASARVTGPANSAAGDLRVAGGTTTLPTNIRPGKTYTVSAYIFTPEAHNIYDTGSFSRQRRILVFMSTDAGTFQSNFGPQVPNTPGVHRVSHTFAVPDNATGAIIGVGCAGSTADNNFVTYVDDVLIEETSVVRDYFDGNTATANGVATAWVGATGNSASYTYESDFTPAWEGTANASTSVLRAPGAPGAYTTAGAFMKSWRSTAWSASSGSSFRMRSLYPTPDANSFYYISPTSAFTAGKTYTAKAKVRIEAPLTGVLRADRLAIQARKPDWTFLAGSNVPPNQAGTYEVSVTFTATSPNDTVRLYHGGTENSGDVWWDEVMLYEGDQSVPFFTGNTPNTPDASYAWEGTPDYSTSTYTAYASSESGLPREAARYTLSSSSVPAEVFLPVPDGKELRFGALGEVISGTPRIQITTRLGEITYATLLPINSSVQTNTVIRNCGGGVTIRLSGSGTIDIQAMTTRILNSGESDPYNRVFKVGEGNSGLRFTGTPAVSGYSSVMDLQALSVNLVETGAWEPQ